MAKSKTNQRTYEEALTWLRDHGFDLLEAPGVANRVFLKKNGSSAAIEKGPHGEAKIFAYPGYLISGEISKLVNRGYQQFFKTTKAETPATAEALKSLHRFTEELKEAIGGISLYNESLGTVAEDYLYDRIVARDKAMRPQRPWEQPKKGKKPA